MKNFLKTLLALTLVSVFLLTGCETPDVSRENSVEISSATSSVDVIDNAFLEEMVSQLGVLYNVENWEDADDIPVYMYLAWYRDYVNSVTSVEERMERYTLEKYPTGFAYPQEEFETYVQKYFDVSTKHLRNSDSYKSDDGVYHIEGGGSNIKYRTRMADIGEIETEGDYIYIRVELSLMGDFSDTEYRVLKIQKETNGFMYLQCGTATDK